MEYLSSSEGYYSATPQVSPMQARHLNQPLPLSYPLRPQIRLFTKSRRLPIDHGIESRRTLYKELRTYWRQFSNVGATSFPDISAAKCFRIVKDDYLTVIIASTM
jgi:hypothetical protein